MSTANPCFQSRDASSLSYLASTGYWTGPLSRKCMWNHLCQLNLKQFWNIWLHTRLGWKVGDNSPFTREQFISFPMARSSCLGKRWDPKEQLPSDRDFWSFQFVATWYTSCLSNRYARNDRGSEIVVSWDGNVECAQRACFVKCSLSQALLIFLVALAFIFSAATWWTCPSRSSQEL